MGHTPCHVVALVLEEPDAEVGRFMETLARIRRGSEPDEMAQRVLASKGVLFLGQGMFLVWHTGHVREAHPPSFHQRASGVEFATAKVFLARGGAEVQIGVLNAPSGTTALPQSVLDAMKWQIQCAF